MEEEKDGEFQNGFSLLAELQESLWRGRGDPAEMGCDMTPNKKGQCYAKLTAPVGL